MGSGDIQRVVLRRLIEEHREAGYVSVEKLIDLIRDPDPQKPESSSGLYTVRVYDGFDHCWTDVKTGVQWDEALAVWRERTKNGMQNTRYGDIDYYAIFPSDTRMVHS